MPGFGKGPSPASVRREQIKAETARYLALRRTSPSSLAVLLSKNCVKRGARWLNRNAPSPGWWRNCIDGGRSRVRMSHDNSSILSLVYEYEQNLADKFGYVIDVLVMRHLEQRYRGINLERLGFSPGSYLTGWQPFPKRHPEVVITSKSLDHAWSVFLEDPPSMMRINYRHPTEREVSDEDLFDYWPPRTLWDVIMLLPRHLKAGMRLADRLKQRA